MATRELSCRVAPDFAVEMDTNAYSVPWRLFERVRVLVTSQTVRITHGGVEVTCHRRSAGRRGRIVDDAQSSIDHAQIGDFATGRFIAIGDSPLLLGPPGVGKTYLAVGLGRAAIVAGYTVLFTRAVELVANLAKAQTENHLEERLTHYARPQLLIVDELGHLPLEPDVAQLFFQLVCRRYERGAILITSNRAVVKGELYSAMQP